MNKFSEVQKFRQWWLWCILVGVVLVPTGMTVFNKNKPATGNLVYDVLIGATVPILVIILFIIMQLRTQITEQGVFYRFFPIHFQVLVITWEEVEKAYVRKYSPILDYGGWGIRLGLGGKGKAYNVSGNMGLQLILKSGKKILIGTQQPNELTELLDQLVKAKVLKPAAIKV